MADFVSRSHSVGNNVHHLQWCTKYRYKMFRKLKNNLICRHAIKDVAERHGIKIRSIAVMPEHIHIVVDLPTTMSQAEAMRILKGGSAYQIFRLVPNFRYRYPRGSLWSRGNFKDTVGRITSDMAEYYVEEQDEFRDVVQSSMSTFA